ncbi:hypothetical protein G647_00240 [Cladophialophora carrionii CBS 160.54]|uniref:Fucose-specific lectin n=1 Tax=Cladophialophora carrionii CBS 160.54 TaxID=1279043 RepID=V9DMA2_9EURO|nr:uncharacterized protein G647_00240 [Cladophialophora carrionii CBS 160.54]ETI27791.1 hypothetical protein G647_00240 [Cladophialophora carrionii CBS 160.54]
MANTTSASVTAGDYIYVFFNQGGNTKIHGYRFTESDKEPQPFTINVDSKDDISKGGEIAALYLSVNNKDEIHLYYIGQEDKPADPTNIQWNQVNEACLHGAKAKATDPASWTRTGMDLNLKRWKGEVGTYLAASLSADANQFPRVFYRAKDTTDVSMAEFNINSTTHKKDWTTTPLTGTSA